MPLSRKVRLALGLHGLLRRLHAIPSPQRSVQASLASRLALAPPRGLVDPWPEGVATTDHVVAGLRVRSYRAATQPELPPGVLFIHGGGFSHGGLAGSDHICARIARDSGATVVALEYGLAPEHPFPGPLEDCGTVLRWMHDEADALGLDPTRLVVVGDSAGGDLAASLVVRARAQGPVLSGQVLIYPALDATASCPSASGYDGPGATADDLSWAWVHYAGGHPLDDPELSPLLTPDLTGLPPALVMTAEYDPLRDEGRAYALRLLEAGVACRSVHYDDYVHGFFSLPRLYEGVDAAWAEIDDFLRSVTAAA